MVTDVWEKAEELKKQKQEEREKAKQRSKSKNGLVKPKWGERRTSWKAADFDSVQALIDQAWNNKDEILDAKKGGKKAAKDLAGGKDVKEIKKKHEGELVEI
jgi:hypothetical protein